MCHPSLIVLSPPTNFLGAATFSFFSHHLKRPCITNNHFSDSNSSTGGKDEITEITDNEDILTSSDHEVSNDDDVMMTSSDDDDGEFSLGTVDITATEVRRRG